MSVFCLLCSKHIARLSFVDLTIADLERALAAQLAAAGDDVFPLDFGRVFWDRVLTQPPAAAMKEVHR